MNGLSAGEYTVVVTTAEETQISTVAVEVYPQPDQVVTETLEQDECQFKSYQVEAIGNFDRFVWSLDGKNIQNSDTNLYDPFATGVYAVQAFDTNGCYTISAPVFVDMDPDSLPTITLLSDPDRLRASAAEEFQWFVDNLFIVNGNAQELILKVNGDYKVKTKNTEGCEFFSETKSVERSELIFLNKLEIGAEGSIDLDYLFDSRLTVVPSSIRSTGVAIYKHFHSGSFIGTVRNSAGLQVAILDFTEVGAHEYRALVSKENLATGIYLVEVVSGQDRFVQKLVIE